MYLCLVTILLPHPHHHYPGSCHLLADGFYEWKKTETGKIPMRITLKFSEPFAFAGLWETWHSPSAETIYSCAIVTTTPNAVVEPLHNRMPVILLPQQENVWLDNKVEDLDPLTQLLTPSPEPMEAYEVSTAVNSVGNDSPQLIMPAQ